MLPFGDMLCQLSRLFAKDKEFGGAGALSVCTRFNSLLTQTSIIFQHTRGVNKSHFLFSVRRHYLLFVDEWLWWVSNRFPTKRSCHSTGTKRSQDTLEEVLVELGCCQKIQWSEKGYHQTWQSVGQAHLWKDQSMWVDPDGARYVWAALCLSILCFSFDGQSVSLTGDPLALSVFTQPFEISLWQLCH